jgi:hypothetical protein
LSTSVDDETRARFSPDELTAYYTWDWYRLAVSHRESVDEPFGPPTLLENPSPMLEDSPTVSRDGLEMIFYRRDGGDTTSTLFRATRNRLDEDFGEPAALSQFDSLGRPRQPYLSADGSELWFASDRGIERARRTADGFDHATAMLESPAEGSLSDPVLSADGLTLFYGGIYMSVRASVDDTFPPGEPVVFPPIPDESYLLPSWISPDGCRLYLAEQGDSGTADIVVSTRAP